MAFKVYKPHFLGNTNSAILNRSQIILSPDLQEFITTNYVELAYEEETKVIRIVPSDSGLKYFEGKIGTIGFYRTFKIKLKGQFEARHSFTEDCIYIYLK